MNVTNTMEEPWLSRTLIKATLEFEKATPSNKEVAALLSKDLKQDEKLIAIRRINTSFGSRNAYVTAYIYSDENRKKLIEPRTKAKEEKAGQEAKKEGAKKPEEAKQQPKKE